ncbi:MAG: exosortase/archaeosortase family protein [Acholeplasmataceae bacterium]|nr:exosortase/archaeosortase family protein [Acholeplasmataceae bacterium]
MYNWYDQGKRLYYGRFGFVADVLLFALITYGFHLVFRYFAIEFMSIPFVHHLAQFLADLVFKVSLWINRYVLQMSITTEADNHMWFSNCGYIKVNLGCSGLKQFYQVLVLFLLFPGPWKHKVWFIPLGFLVMFLTNIFRIVSLSVVLLWKPDCWEFFHNWILRPFFYFILFCLWLWWVEVFRRKGKASVSTY